MPMTTWTNEELGRIGEAEELHLASSAPVAGCAPS